MTGYEYREELKRGLQAGAVAGLDGAGPRDGLSWSWELDVEALLAAVTGPAPWSHDPVRASGQPAVGDAPTAAQDPAGRTVSPGVASEPEAGLTPRAADADSAHDPVASAAPATEAAAGLAAADLGLDPADADLAEYLDAVEAGRCQVVPLPVVAGRVAELVPGPGLAGWLGTGGAAGLEDGALAGMAASYRRLASWAQAGELSVVAELASRSAAADDRAGVDDQGRPAKVTASASAEVSLALTMSQAAASWWADLAVTLRWRLTATGTALASGVIDLTRARLIADATACLDDDTAQAVQDTVLPKAGTQTTGQLRAALRRAVIAADPDGADRRREDAERQAKVMLYPDDQGTASLGGYSLPGIGATAAMARITALARALQASGAGGGIDLLRAHVFIGLLLGTLPYIPPPADAPPDQPPPDDGPPDTEPPDHGDESGDGGQPGDGPAGGVPQGGEAQDSNPGGDRRGGGTARGRAPAGCPGRDDHRSHREDRGGSHRKHGDTPPASPGSHHQDKNATPAGHGSHRDDDGDQPVGQRSDGGGQRPDPDAQRGGQDSQSASDGNQHGQPGNEGNQPPDRDGPRGPDPGDGSRDSPGEPAGHHTHDDDQDDPGWARPPPAWPPVPALLKPGPAAMNHLTPATGAGKLLDLTLPWATLTGDSRQPGHLGRLGPITPAQARHLAGLATTDPDVRWRIILTNPRGQALATTRLTRRGTSHQAGLVKLITVTIGPDDLTQPRPEDLPPALHRILAAARTAAAQRSARDIQAPGGCAHAGATTAYRPTTWLRDYTTARDLTCRFPTCRQPAWRCDLDHTTPYDQGGPTCSCNLGGLCRFHHQLKGQSRWHLEQAIPGIFTWTTPTGRRYTIEPDTHAA